jgi:uncharacterized membrane protein
LPTYAEIEVRPNATAPDAFAARETESAPPALSRVPSVDILRGCAIILMTLDHTRDFFTNSQFAPEDIAHTTGALFFTRWITHFCAPVFFLLAGSGAYFSIKRGRSQAEVSRYLLIRGSLLVLLNLTVVALAWSSELFLFSGVLWSLGFSMIALAFLIRLPLRWIAIISAVTIAGHNMLDRFDPVKMGFFGPLWLVLHGYGAFWVVQGKVAFSVVWPLIPWAAVMALGYALGPLLDGTAQKKLVLSIGALLTAAFLVLRFFNLYGNSHARLFGIAGGHWQHQSSAVLTVASFLNTLKYPPSLQFLLMTLGPILMVLAGLSGIKASGRMANLIAVFGRVALFYYAVHLFVVRMAAFYTALFFKQKAVWLLYGGFMMNPAPAGYGHGVAFIYAMTLGIVVFMYPLCWGFMRFKQNHAHWEWLHYF